MLGCSASMEEKKSVKLFLLLEPSAFEVAVWGSGVDGLALEGVVSDDDGPVSASSASIVEKLAERTTCGSGRA